ncbi:DUF4367 domain-containing protein [Pseudoflavonifractor phocaeensis]|uniref:DUF4367 domain-containing protein n=1 Tax=Pseudoflavonifractor phocaeensis TaxID=1870988 RepID=UPI00313A7BDE
MNQSERFDALLRAALLEAQRLDWAGVLEGPLPEPAFSRRYLRRREALLQNPFPVLRPLWQRALRAAVWMLVAAGIALGGLWLNPSTRAWVEQVIFHRYPEVDEYRFSGDPEDVGDLGNIRPSYVPDGFVETEALELMGNWYITYQNEAGVYIDFSVIAAADGSFLGFDNEHSTHSEITVNGMKGELYTAVSSEYENYLLLSDENKGCIYFFSSKAGTETLIQIAESLGAVS